jgi:hypothetical protein
LNKLWTWPFLVLLGWAVMSCRFNEAARADVPESNLNEAFFDALRPVVERGIVAESCGRTSMRSYFWRP